ncbi:hypothetical protein [Streptomyces sp. ODS05-4]|uniref:hypothetical protein n=1 Tax=Streptomyces sp. ODS05-4 TaxID=2944939 RepID=UPI0021095112|nr:hypothetical protein [Streptomyces sp. ODS05-4]
MGIKRRCAGVVLAGITCAGIISSPAAFAAPQKAQDLTQGFHITNLTGYTLKRQGEVLKPGDVVDHEVTFHLGSNTREVDAYQAVDEKGAYQGRIIFTFDVNDINQPSSQCSPDDFETGLACGGGGKDVQVLDAKPKTYDVPASDSQRIADVLNTLCADGKPAQCSFDAKKEESVLEPGKVYGNPVANNTDKDATTTISASDTVTNTDLVEAGFRISASLTKAINAEINAKYSHTWTNSHTFSQSIKVTVGAHREAWIEETIPALRTTGDLVVKMGNSTWNLHDVHFDTPDPSSSKAVFEVKDKPLTSQQRAELPKQKLLKLAAR